MNLQDKLDMIIGEGNDITLLDNNEVKQLLDMAGALLTADKIGHARVMAAKNALLQPTYGDQLAETLAVDFSEDWLGWCLIVSRSLKATKL